MISLPKSDLASGSRGGATAGDDTADSRGIQLSFAFSNFESTGKHDD
jgi:hypothetical protein